MIKLSFIVLFALIPLLGFSQVNYRVGITYTQPKFLKSPGLTLEFGEGNNIIQVRSSIYLHTPIPNQTVNSISIKDIGFYDHGFAYLRNIPVKEISIGAGLGFGVIRGPRYHKINYYELGGYNIFRVEKDKFTYKTLNLNLMLKRIYFISVYNIMDKNIRIGTGIRLK